MPRGPTSTPTISSAPGPRSAERHPAIVASTYCGASSKIAPSSRSFRCGNQSMQSGGSPERTMRKPTTTRKTATSSSSSNPSSTITTSSPEISLDPQGAKEWEELRQLGHRMVDEMLEYLRTARERPVWRPVPDEVRARLSGPAPRQPAAAADVYEEFKRDVLPYPTGNIHPRFWGCVIGTGTPVGMLADMLASGMNPQVAEFDDSSAVVENQVIGWLVELLGLPPGTHGLLVSGGSMANLVGLAVARIARAGFDARARGLQTGGGGGGGGGGGRGRRRTAAERLCVHGNPLVRPQGGGAARTGPRRPARDPGGSRLRHRHRCPAREARRRQSRRVATHLHRGQRRHGEYGRDGRSARAGRVES